MIQLIEKDAMLAEIERILKSAKEVNDSSYVFLCNHLKSFINTLEVKEVDLEKESELIANGIMISVQSNKYGTNIYNTERNDFNHYHLQMAARKGIEIGLKCRKENK